MAEQERKMRKISGGRAFFEIILMTIGFAIVVWGFALQFTQPDLKVWWKVLIAYFIGFALLWIAKHGGRTM